MDEEKKDGYTGAQQQIERLMKLKLEKDKKDKMRLESGETVETPRRQAVKDEEPAQKPAEKREPAVSRKKAANTIKVEKRLYEKLHKLVNALNATGGARITKAKFVNSILKEFLALDIDYGVVKSREEIKKIFERIKTGN
jgi:hypothetical protein